MKLYLPTLGDQVGSDPPRARGSFRETDLNLSHEVSEGAAAGADGAWGPASALTGPLTPTTTTIALNTTSIITTIPNTIYDHHLLHHYPQFRHHHASHHYYLLSLASLSSHLSISPPASPSYQYHHVTNPALRHFTIKICLIFFEFVLCCKHFHQRDPGILKFRCLKPFTTKTSIQTFYKHAT